MIENRLNPELELSNNLAENSMRPVALGRKNWIHIGKPTGRTKGCSNSLGRGKLPPVETPSARLFGNDPSWACRSPDPAPSGTHSKGLGLLFLIQTICQFPSRQGIGESVFLYDKVAR